MPSLLIAMFITDHKMFISSENIPTQRDNMQKPLSARRNV